MAYNLEDAQAKTADFSHQMGRIIARTWADPEFKKSLIANPAQVLRDNGIPVPDNVKLTAGDLGAGNSYVIPLPPRPPQITDEQLTGLATMDGSCAGSAGSLSCPCCSAGTAGCAH